MGNNNLQQEIMDLVADVTESDIRRDDVETSFIKGVNVDSLMALEIVAALEKKYKIEIKEEDLPKLGTLDDMVLLVDKLLKAKTGKSLSVVKVKKAKTLAKKKTKKIKRKKTHGKK